MKKLRLQILKAVRVFGAGFVLVTALFAMVSCNNLLNFNGSEDKNNSNETALTFSVKDFSRSVLPGNPALSDLTNFKVYGVQSWDKYNSWSEYPDEEKEQFGQSYASLEELQTAKIPVSARYTGQYWRFYLTATKGENGAVYAGMNSECICLQLNETNDVSFVLSYADKGSGTGSFAFTLDFSADTENIAKATKAVASLYAVDSDGNTAETATKSSTVGNGSTTITSTPVFSIESVPVGTYHLGVKVYAGANEDVVIGQWYEVVQIAGNLTSSATRSITKLLTVYTVTYHLNLGVDEANSFPTSALVPTTVTKLATPEREGYFFAGWYTDESLETPLSLSSSTPLTADFEVWAKWVAGTLSSLTKDNVAAAVSTLDPASATLQSPVQLTVTGEIDGNTIIDVKNAMWSNSNAYIALDLSETTGLTEIGSNYFDGCKSLTSIILPEGITSIGYCAFINCTNLAVPAIPDSVETLGSNAFAGCSAIGAVTIGKGVTAIDYTSFNDAGVTEFTVPSENTSFVALDGVLYKKEGTTPIKLVAYPKEKTGTTYSVPEGVTEILNFAFTGCSLENIQLPATLQTISDYTFSNCNALTSITVAGNSGTFKSEGGVLYTADGKTLILYPQAKTDISFTIPNGVETIKTNAFFHNIYITSLTFPQSLKFIEYYAFYYCYSLQTVVMSDDYVWKQYGAEVTYEDVITYGDLITTSGMLSLWCSSNTFYPCAKTTKTISEYAAEKEAEIEAAHHPVAIYTDGIPTGTSLEVNAENFIISEFIAASGDTPAVTAVWYKFTTENGTVYTVSWCDGYNHGNNGFTDSTENDFTDFLDSQITVYDYTLSYASLSNASNPNDDGTPFTFIGTGSTMYIKVDNRDGSGTGKCAFRVSSN